MNKPIARWIVFVVGCLALVVAWMLGGSEEGGEQPASTVRTLPPLQVPPGVTVLQHGEQKPGEAFLGYLTEEEFQALSVPGKRQGSERYVKREMLTDGQPYFSKYQRRPYVHSGRRWFEPPIQLLNDPNEGEKYRAVFVPREAAVPNK